MAGSQESCEDVSVRSRTSLPCSVSHLIGSMLLLLGIAAMHHLVVSGCVTAVVHQAAVHAGGHGWDAGPIAAKDEPRQESAPGGPSGTGAPVDHSGAALCLAVLVSAWLLTPLLRYRRALRGAESVLRAPPPVVAAPPRPPDLVVLSVSRT